MQTMPNPYVRAENPALSRLVAEIEQDHDAMISPQRVTFHGYELEVDPGVFNPTLSQVGELLAQQMVIPAGARVLDLGTGAGGLAIVAAAQAQAVLAVDNQPAAVACAGKNVARLGLQAKIEVRHSDLFSEVGATECFHVIVTNFPFVPWPAETAWQRHNFDEGHHQLQQLLTTAKAHLHPGGRLFLTWSDLGDRDEFFTLLAREHYLCRKAAERYIGEIGFYVYELVV